MGEINLRLTPGVAVRSAAGTDPTVVELRTTGRSGGYELGRAPASLLPWVAALEAGLPAESPVNDLPGTLWPTAYALLERLAAVGALSTTIARPDTGEPLVSITPDRHATRPVWHPTGPPPTELAPSDRILLRHDASTWLAELPATGVVVTFHRPADVELLTRWPRADVSDLDAADLATIAALIDNGFLGAAPGASAADDGQERFWEFHDYYFHHRARPGHYHARYGGTYRFGTDEPPPPVIKAPMSEVRIPLSEGSTLTMPYGEVRERRRSIRTGEGALDLADLGAFLGHVARVRGYGRSTYDDVSRRSYPGGGARYELEIYPLVHDVAGLAPGAYHYDPQGHVLEHLSPATPAVGAALHFAGRVSTRGTPPQVLLVITARFARVAWKYESIAYSLVLKHVGVLYAVMYDTATAMGLSPCALGAGNIDFHAMATGVDPLVEPAVGEFILGGRPLTP